MLRNFLDGLTKSAPFVVMDNQAGMEHLSRLTTNDVDLLLEVAAPTVVNGAAARRIDELVEKLPVKVARKGLVINREVGHTSGTVSKLIAEGKFELLGRIPLSEAVAALSADGKPVTELSLDAPAARAVADIVDRYVL